MHDMSAHRGAGVCPHEAGWSRARPVPAASTDGEGAEAVRIPGT